jgi:hypothetical protein
MVQPEVARLTLHIAYAMKRDHLGHNRTNDMAENTTGYLEEFLENYNGEHGSLDLSSYATIKYVPHLGFGDVILHENLNNLDARLLTQMPGPFMLVQEKLGNDYLRKVLEWCKRKIERSFQLHREWRRIGQKDVDRRWLEFLALFWFLWAEWFDVENNEVDRLYWSYESESMMGVSMTEFLSYLVSYILSETTGKLERQIRREVTSMGKDQEFHHRLLLAVGAIHRKKDTVLARDFLNHYTTGHSWRFNPASDGFRESFLKLSLKVFASAKHLPFSESRSAIFVPVRTGTRSPESLSADSISVATKEGWHIDDVVNGVRSMRLNRIPNGNEVQNQGAVM